MLGLGKGNNYSLLKLLLYYMFSGCVSFLNLEMNYINVVNGNVLRNNQKRDFLKVDKTVTNYICAWKTRNFLGLYCFLHVPAISPREA